MRNLTLQWDWNEFCGADNFPFWNNDYKDLDLCFQYLCLKLPALSLIAIVSGYYSGFNGYLVRRSNRERWILKVRSAVTLCLSALPVIQTYIEITILPGSLHPIDYLNAAVECFSWLVHFSYIIALCHRLGRSLRGPVLLGVLWTINYIVSCITLHSIYVVNLSQGNSPIYNSQLPLTFASINVFFQSIYLLTLLPSESSHPHQQLHVNTNNQNGEHSPSFGVYLRFREDLDPGYLGVAMDGWGSLARLFFYWVNPLMNKGVAGNLQNQDELFELPENLTTSYLYTKMRKALTSEYIYATPSTRVSLFKALHICFWKEFYGIGILKLITDVTGFFGPLLLHSLVTFIENKQEPFEKGYFYALGLCAVSLCGAICMPHFNFLMSLVGLKIRGALITTVYRKTLTLSSITLSHFSTGEIVNFMSTDMDRIVNSCASFHAFWSIPFQIAVTLYLLYQQVGLSFLAGVAFTIILIPINKCIASKIGKLSEEMMDRKDKRIMVMSELLRGIRAIKLYVWEEFFINRVTGIRKEELKFLGRRKYLDAMCVYFWATTPVLISILTFSTYTLLGHKLTAPVVFTSIALLNMLIAPLNAFPWVLNGLTEAWVSLKRVQRLLELPDVDLEEYYNPLPDSEEAGTLIIEDGNFHWGETNFTLSSINFTALEGQLVAVTGPVGSGKSSLLGAILAELERCSGSVACANFDQGFGYVSQTAWIQRGTIKENILFGEPLEQERYWSVLEACALIPDLEALPKRDLTGVGEAGSTLSGGQKTRIALARAVYQDHSIYLLDDILSAVDPHVARHIFNHCICGLLKNKTRILCTHQSKFLVHADLIVMLQNGLIVQQGPPSEVLTDYRDLVTSSEFESTELSSHFDEPEVGKTESVETILAEEEIASGSLEVNVYLTYLMAVGLCLTPLILISVIMMQVSRNLIDWWLAFWVTHDNSTGLHISEYSFDLDKRDSMFYMIVYLSLAGFNAVSTIFRAFLFAFGGLVAARFIHKKLLNSVIKAKMTFFDSSSLGRILNRFSSDVYTIDDSLPFILNILIAQFFSLLGTLIMTLYGLPWLCLVLAPLIPVYHWLQNNYRLTSRELKRLSSVTLSPLYSHFNETMQGLTTIRAFKAVRRFRRDNAWFLEANQKALLSSNAASQWLALRLQMIGVAMITGVSILAAVQHHLEVADPGLIGLAISYALTLTGSLGGVVNAFTETERELVSVERARQYFDDYEGCPEQEMSKFLISPPFAWPGQGVITFNNVSLKYREHLSYALRDVSFSTRPVERVGVVGRTGAGKTSLITALFRLVEISEGTITIDTVNTKLISLTELRSRLGVIPQDPFVFEGTIRLNLDPHDTHSDAELWSALSKAHLTGVVKSLGGLNAEIKQGSLSVGQKQLLCLARAILHNAKIICIDEATANVDEETDRCIQQTLRSCFIQSTVITIAHRLQTIMNSDRVLVMGDGQILEFDSPSSLRQEPMSVFYQLANEIS